MGRCQARTSLEEWSANENIQHLGTGDAGLRLRVYPESAVRRAWRVESGLLNGVVSDARDFAANHGFQDDVCLLGMELESAAVSDTTTV